MSVNVLNNVKVNGKQGRKKGRHLEEKSMESETRHIETFAR